MTRHITAAANPPASPRPARTRREAVARAHHGPGVQVPVVSQALLGWFTWYSRRYLRRHFHSLRISVSGFPSKTDLPLVIYSNHASWWDPLVGLVVKSEFFGHRTLYAPIDAAMLQRYRMFGRLGFFGVEQKTRRGAAQFLRLSEAILQNPRALLAVTPQSRFADVRERPVNFASGLGHLAARTKAALFVPFVTEYVFWEERLPEILVRFGEATEVVSQEPRGCTADDYTKLFEQKLEAAQNVLATETQQRAPAAFQIILRGGTGQGGVYDLWRGLLAKIRGERFNREHGAK